MPNKHFTFLGSRDHYDVDDGQESYCCNADDDYCVEWNDDDPTEGFVIYRWGVAVECSNLVTVATAIIMQEAFDVDAFDENGVETCEKCGGYWIKGDLPMRHSLNCRHDTGESYIEHLNELGHEAEARGDEAECRRIARLLNEQNRALYMMNRGSR